MELDAPTKPQTPRAIGQSGSAASSPPPAQAEAAELSASQALDRSQLARTRFSLAVGVVVMLGVIALSSLLGGDDRARHLFQLGIGWMAVSTAARVWVLRSKPEWDSRLPEGAYGILIQVGLVPALYYFGPFSGVTIALPVGLFLVGLDRDKFGGILMVAFLLGVHLFVALPIIMGWTTDIGLLPTTAVPRPVLAVAEVMILALIAVSYVLLRGVRNLSAMAFAELADAKRIIGDQQQVLGEVQERVDQLNRAKRGRWTGKTIGHWQLGDVLGRGGMGEVYEANDEGGRPAAVKVLTQLAEESPSLVQRFHRELSIAARLESPHIVRVLDVSPASAAVPYLVMERLRGTDLAERLRTEVRMSLPAVVAMLEQVAAGLDVAHGAGVVHRDLKPHNLFLHDETCWKILDFGVAKVLGGEGTLTQEALVGTPQYMAPEQALGQDVTHLSDIYALGAITYRCLTGRLPHHTSDLAALIYQVVHVAPARPGALADVPREVDDVLAVAMAKDPRRRFQSAGELVQQLSSAIHRRQHRLEPPSDAWA
jgi:hypothetical protein